MTKSIYKSKSDYPISTFGPGGGAFQALGYCSEFMGSAKYDTREDGLNMVGCACRYAYVDENGDGHWREQANDDRFGLMGNFYLSQNKQGKVLKILAKRRISNENYTESIRAVLLAKYGQEKPISMGGVFLIKKGTAYLHIMPKYWPKEPSTNESVNNEWLKYYKVEMSPDKPLVCLSIIHSHDPGYNLRMEHTHCFNLKTQTEAGHYHYDVSPESIVYEGYFNPVDQVFRLDGPPHKK